MLIFSHPTGNANVRAAASGFFGANVLYEFHTSVASFQGTIVDKLGVISPFSEIRRRRFDVALKPVTRMWPWRELGRMACTKVGLTNLMSHEKDPFSIDAVYRSQDRRVASTLKKAAKRGANAVYAYEDGALFSFMKAKSLGFKCYYDLPTGYWRASRRLLEVERERRPDWATTMTGFLDSQEKLDQKDEELRMADCVFVASKFTANTLKEYPDILAPVKVIPYGFPPVFSSRRYQKANVRRPLKLLFVGKLTQQKGIADLFAAVDTLNQHVVLTLVGHKASGNCAALDAALSKHRWIPSLPHGKVLELMREHDVLVFPSLFDGFGLVITEAMSQGTPVITTERTAGPDFIKHDQNGWLVQAGSPQHLQAAIEELLFNPSRLATTGQNALETARLRPWEVYIQEMIETVNYLQEERSFSSFRETKE